MEAVRLLTSSLENPLPCGSINTQNFGASEEGAEATGKSQKTLFLVALLTHRTWVPQRRELRPRGSLRVQSSLLSVY